MWVPLIGEPEVAALQIAKGQEHDLPGRDGSDRVKLLICSAISDEYAKRAVSIEDALKLPVFDVTSGRVRKNRCVLLVLRTRSKAERDRGIGV